MNRRGIMVALVVSLGLAWLASALVKGGFSFGGDVKEVLVAAIEIPERQVLNEKMFVKQEIPADLFAAGMVTTLDKPAQYFARTGLLKGEILYQTRLGLVKEEPELSYMIDRTQGVITIGITSITAVSGIIKPGDHVDVYATYEYKVKDLDGGKERTEATTKKIIPSCRIIAVGKDVMPPVKGRLAGQFGRQRAAVDVKQVTLAVSDTEMERVIFAHTRGKIHLVLKSQVGDTAPEEHPGYSSQDVQTDLFETVECIRANKVEFVRVEK